MAEKKSAPKRKTNLQKLYTVMNQMVIDAVDKEVVKRFKLIIDSVENDITKTTLVEITKHYDSLNMSQFGEGLQPYVKHYVFMMKRACDK
ncbi:MAG TPA: hypothetical protein VF857_10715 [Spirochaetota bacterium]